MWICSRHDTEGRSGSRRSHVWWSHEAKDDVEGTINTRFPLAMIRRWGMVYGNRYFWYDATTLSEPCSVPCMIGKCCRETGAVFASYHSVSCSSVTSPSLFSCRVALRLALWFPVDQNKMKIRGIGLRGMELVRALAVNESDYAGLRGVNRKVKPLNKF